MVHWSGCRRTGIVMNICCASTEEVKLSKSLQVNTPELPTAWVLRAMGFILIYNLLYSIQTWNSELCCSKMVGTSLDQSSLCTINEQLCCRLLFIWVLTTQGSKLYFFDLRKTSHLIQQQQSTLNFYGPSIWGTLQIEVLKYFTNTNCVVFYGTVCISNMKLSICVFCANYITELFKLLLTKNQTQAYLSLQISISRIQFTLSSNKRTQCRLAQQPLHFANGPYLLMVSLSSSTEKKLKWTEKAVSKSRAGWVWSSLHFL